MKRSKGGNKPGDTVSSRVVALEKRKEEGLCVVSVCFSVVDSSLSLRCDRCDNQVRTVFSTWRSSRVRPSKTISSWSGSGALLGDERCGIPDSSLDPVLSGVFVCVSVWAPERGHLFLIETDACRLVAKPCSAAARQCQVKLAVVNEGPSDLGDSLGTTSPISTH